jgi:1-acyl-sn-glycerol-3-phosphate acyltransferase
MIALYSFIQIIGNLNNEMAIQSMMLIGCKIFMFLLSIKITISADDLNKYMKLLYSDKKFLVVFNHTTFVDGFIIFSTFPRSSFLMLKTYVYKVIGYTEKFHKNVHGVFISKGETTAKIIETVEKRKEGENVLFVAPGSGNISSVPGCITEFRGSGAFTGRYPILPIIIKYEDESLNHNYDNGESMVHSCLKLFLLSNYKISIKVGDLIEATEEEVIDHYKERVYNYMNKEYQNM